MLHRNVNNQIMKNLTNIIIALSLLFSSMASAQPFYVGFPVNSVITTFEPFNPGPCYPSWNEFSANPGLDTIVTGVRMVMIVIAVDSQEIVPGTWVQGDITLFPSTTLEVGDTVPMPFKIRPNVGSISFVLKYIGIPTIVAESHPCEVDFNAYPGPCSGGFVSSGIITCNVLPPSGIDSYPAQATEFGSVYPNPASKLITAELPSEELSKIEIISSTGQLLLVQENASKKMLINIAHLSNGYYLLRITSGIRTSQHKICIIH